VKIRFHQGPVEVLGIDSETAPELVLREKGGISDQGSNQTFLKAGARGTKLTSEGQTNSRSAKDGNPQGREVERGLYLRKEGLSQLPCRNRGGKMVKKDPIQRKEGAYLNNIKEEKWSSPGK